mmetsp:Transcript_20357/g.41268  ORF Transcript_20357/g.41268 Transcript_20357/m.41268 type:complete len:158 (-) Transcript_20357:173-646(-)
MSGLPYYRSHGEPNQISFKHSHHGVCSWVLNILWIIVGGWHMFLTWFTVGLILCLTCIGIPCGWQTMKISFFLLLPFGTTLEYADHEDDGVTCCCRCSNFILNVIWALTVGWILALQAVLTGALLCLTIVGIPFGWQCFKLTVLCFRPFGIKFNVLD